MRKSRSRIVPSAGRSQESALLEKLEPTAMFDADEREVAVISFRRCRRKSYQFGDCFRHAVGNCATGQSRIVLSSPAVAMLPSGATLTAQTSSVC